MKLSFTNGIKKILLNIRISNAKRTFSKNNGIKLDRYVSSSKLNNADYNVDHYIGKDVFTKNIILWLDFFKGNEYILLKLLKNYKYYTENEIRKYMDRLFDKVCMDFPEEIKEQQVFFITFPTRKGVKSGGDDLHAILGSALMNRYKKDNIIVDFDKFKNMSLNKARVIIFIDDVVGSGTTLYRNIKDFYNGLSEEQCEGFKAYLAVLYANKTKIKEKIKQLKNKGFDVDIYDIDMEVHKCFANNYILKNSLVNKYRDIVMEYENEIHNNKLPDDNEKECVMGFENCQYLVSTCYNTPNNTLSTFWRPSKKSTPLFTRTTYINVRPSVNVMKESKRKNIKRAYNYGKQKNKH